MPRQVRGGRPSKLTPEMHEEIVGLVREGNYLDTSAACCGVNRRTVQRWIARGRRLEDAADWTQYTEEDRRYLDFHRAVRKARATAETSDLRKVGSGTTATGLPDWRAAAWRLERRNPERWAKRSKLELGPPPELIGREDLDYDKMDDAQLDALIEGIEAGLPDDEKDQDERET